MVLRRITAVFACQASTIESCLKSHQMENARQPGWYNTVAFEKEAEKMDLCKNQ